MMKADDQHLMPLRLFNVKKWIKNSRIVFKKADDWNFCIVSHTWGNVTAWRIRDTTIDVTAFSSLDLTIASKCIYDMGYKWAWIDNICIDQNSKSELQREITHMGEYYENACICLIFTGGLYNIGNVINDDYSAPRWHHRIWTLQEVVLSKNKVYICKGKEPQSKFVHKKWNYKGQHYFVIRHRYFEDSVIDAAYDIQKHVNNNEPVPGNTIQNMLDMFNYVNTQDWNIPNVIRECGRREATKEEDVIYGILGLLKVTNIAIERDISKTEALLKLIQSVPEESRALFMICEWNNNAIPEFSHAAWGLDVDECIANAYISDGSMYVKTQCIDILSIYTFTSNVVQAGSEGTPRSSLQEMKLTTHNGEVVTSFGRVPNDVNDCTLVLIGSTSKSWAVQALKTENVGICVVVTMNANVAYKVGLLIIGNDELKWAETKTAVAYKLNTLHTTLNSSVQATR